MRRVLILAHVVVSFLLFSGVALAQQISEENLPGGAPAPAGEASLQISLRLEDHSPFSGQATLRVISAQGADMTGVATDTEGEAIYSNLPPGKYTVEANAPGFLPIQQTIEIEPGKRTQTLFLIMKPDAPHVPLALGPTSQQEDNVPANPKSWLPADLDDNIPPVSAGVSCSLPTVLQGAGHRVKQLAANLERFSATEHVEHFAVDSLGARHAPEDRSFEYVVTVMQSGNGLILLDEYRNGSTDQALFPARIATMGLPAMALIFHPQLATDFHFRCEGLGRWDGHPAWQVHFAQREDRANRMRSYRVGGAVVSVPMKGRAWIDAATYQVVHLDSELVHPLRGIGLTEERLSIDYKPVHFQTHTARLWLPQAAEIYVERAGRRYYRRHTFSDFKIFTVDTEQKIHPPKESYAFTNTSDRDITGILTVTPLPGKAAHAITIKFTIPAGGSIFKIVGPGKDVSIPVESVGGATFVHNGPADAIRADAYFVRESTLDIIADTAVPINRL